MRMTELEITAAAAREHAENTRLDIEHAMTRMEHIRLTRLALEAEALAVRLETLAAGVAV
jgi:hypothetical protein